MEARKSAKLLAWLIALAVVFTMTLPSSVVWAAEDNASDNAAKIGDQEYILSENHTLDIPFGEDIYNLEYPSNYKFGKKVE